MYRNPPKIIAFKSGDISGDKISDNVFLSGIGTKDSPFIEEITLIIQDGKTKKLTKVPLSENAGYNPRLLLVRFTENQALDIMVSIDSGGSGGIMYHYIYSFINNRLKLMFDFNSYNKKYNYQVTYRDNYKVEVISLENGKKYIIDLTTKGFQYLNEIYYKNGKLKKPIEGFVNPLSGLYPVDFDSNDIYELLAYEKIAGRYNADSLGYILNTLAWNGNEFILDNQSIAIF